MSFKLSTKVAPNKVFIIDYTKLEERYDSAFYSPKYAKFFDSKVKWKTCKDISYSIQHPPEYPRNYAENGMQLIRSQNVRPTGINLSNSPVFFAKEFLATRKTVTPEIGDVLIVRSGVNAGDVCVIDIEHPYAIIGADTLLLKPNTLVIPKFIQVYFNTTVGRMLLNKYLTGATNKHISPYYMSRVPIPVPTIKKQHAYIKCFENSLNEKQQKELQAEELLSSIDTYLLEELGITLPERDNSLKKRIFKTSLSDISGKRWDANNVSCIKYLENQVWKYPKITLKDVLSKSPQYGANEVACEGNSDTEIRYIRITDIDEHGNLKAESWKTAKNIDGKYLLNNNDILFARSGSVGKCYIHKDLTNSSIFAGYLIRFVVDKNLINPDYLFYYCNSSAYKFWVRAIERPAVQSNINSEEFKALLLPLPSIAKQNEIAEQIKDIRLKAKQLRDGAEQDLQLAKDKIAKMILGTE